MCNLWEGKETNCFIPSNNCSTTTFPLLYKWNGFLFLNHFVDHKSQFRSFSMLIDKKMFSLLSEAAAGVVEMFSSHE